MTMNDNPQTANRTEAASKDSTLANAWRHFLSGLPTILVLTTLGLGWLSMHHINSHESHVEETTEPDVPELTDRLKMTEGKRRAGQFESSPVEAKAIQHVHMVPGRLRYDQTQHITLKAPLDGILSELLVAPGDRVSRGDLLAVIRSPEVGQARANVLKCRRELDLAQQILQREKMLGEKLQQLSELLDQNRPTTEVEMAIADFAFGNYQQEILSAYFRVCLADENLIKIQPLANDGAVPGRLVREREAERQLAEVAFHTARDQAAYAVQQANQRAEAKVADAERQVGLAWQGLETLLGYPPDPNYIDQDDDSTLSRLEIRAPIAGSIESRQLADQERVARGDPLIVLANTDVLTVEASIRDSDWSVADLNSGTEISVIVPALGDQEMPARVRYFGREVQADTNAIPLVAQIDNSLGLLRPGMFVRVSIPIGPPRESLSIHPESILTHENQAFVFLDLSEGRFQKVNVKTGLTAENWVEITEGLTPGQQVVTNGTFLLKSEWLLRGEGGE